MRRALALAICVAAVCARAGEPDRIAVLLSPADTARALASAALAARGWTLGAAVDGDAHTSVHIAGPGRPPVAPLWDAIDVLSALRGVHSAGLLVDARRGRVSLFGGDVIVAFRETIAEPDARRWGAAHGLELDGPLKASREYLFRARTTPARLLALAAEVELVAELTPVVPVWAETAVLAAPRNAGYHRFPNPRLLVAIVAAGVLCEDVLFPVPAGVSVPTSPEPGMCAWEVLTSAEPSAVLVQLQGRPQVRVALAALSLRPLTLITKQLVVRFRSTEARLAAAPVLAAHGLVHVRDLPYSEKTVVYKHPVGGYESYDAARDLVLQNHAEFALPNLIAVNGESSCGATDCVASADDYQALTHMCEPWDWLSMTDGEIDAVVGVLDTGIRSATEPAGLECTHLSVGTAVDFGTMKTCAPEDPTLWCDATCKDVWSGWGGTAHGAGVGLIVGAAHGAEDLKGIAPRVPLLNARRNREVSVVGDKMTDVALADALWWMAGGNPGWTVDCVNYVKTPVCPNPCTQLSACVTDSLPVPLPAERRASVLNLSFWRKDSVSEACTTPGVCNIVCENAASCSIVESALERIRFPWGSDVGLRPEGTLVVNAIGVHGLRAGNETTTYCYTGPTAPNMSQWDTFTDLAESEFTLAVGSVMKRGEPFWTSEAGECLIQFPGPFADVVAPLGGRGAAGAPAQLCSTCANGGPMHFGESSAAAAAVSGVAALMLDLSPALTAAQADCILRETARVLPAWSGSLGRHVDMDCMFTAGHSPCFGNGMVDACAAMDMAAICTDSTDEACTCLPDGRLRPPAQFQDPGEVVQVLLQGDKLVWEAGARTIPTGVPEPITEVLACLTDPRCSCPDELLPCVAVLVRNPSPKPWRSVTADLCVGERCWTQPMTPVRRWRSGKSLRIPLTATRDMRWELKSTGRPLTLRLLSRGVPIDFGDGSTADGAEAPRRAR